MATRWLAAAWYPAGGANTLVCSLLGLGANLLQHALNTPPACGAARAAADTLTPLGQYHHLHTPPPGLPILTCREGQEAIAKRHVKAAALALQMAAQRDPSGNISERQQLASQLAALQQQRQQQQQQDVSHAGGSQQQAVQVDVDVNAPRKLLEIEETLLGTTPRQHSSTLVGRWCAAFDAFTLAWVRLGVGLAYWALSVKGRSGGGRVGVLCHVTLQPAGSDSIVRMLWQTLDRQPRAVSVL